MLQHRDLPAVSCSAALGGTALFSRARADERAGAVGAAGLQGAGLRVPAGGNDGHNMVVPLTQARVQRLQGGARLAGAAGRQRRRCCRSQTPDGTPYGLNPGLQRHPSALGAGQAGRAGQCRHAGAAGDARAVSRPTPCRCRPICSRTPTRSSRCRAACRRLGRHRLGRPRRRRGAAAERRLRAFRPRSRSPGRRCSAPATSCSRRACFPASTSTVTA